MTVELWLLRKKIQNLDDTVSILLCSNALEKEITPSLLFTSPTGKY